MERMPLGTQLHRAGGEHFVVKLCTEWKEKTSTDTIICSSFYKSFIHWSGSINKTTDFFFLYCFWAIPAAYGGSQARGQIRAVAAGLYHSHSNARSKLHL